ncbi:Ubac2 [Phodopus roborovskii]|uniref:Ubac2 protein n=1 Tax=Phodopus roborovskii TaxID=109678 RepID=A0AAU9ZNX5_PHORO|nr:Ubac2 [Phodopus roborovskii]
MCAGFPDTCLVHTPGAWQEELLLCSDTPARNVTMGLEMPLTWRPCLLSLYHFTAPSHESKWHRFWARCPSQTRR